MSFVGYGQNVRNKIIEQAKKDSGKFETKNNGGFTEKYHKVYVGQGQLGISRAAPYCGIGLYSWYILAGINPNIYFPARAINWQLYCRKPLIFSLMGVQDLQALPKAGAVVYKISGGGHHVGLLEKAEGSYIYTYEANTSNARSVTKYDKKGQGSFYLRTSINNKSIKPIYYCDCVAQSTNIKP